MGIAQTLCLVIYDLLSLSFYVVEITPYKAVILSRCCIICAARKGKTKSARLALHIHIPGTNKTVRNRCSSCLHKSYLKKTIGISWTVNIVAGAANYMAIISTIINKEMQ